MAKGGARPGAGRPRGPSKATIEKALIAERTVSEAKTSGKRLAKEVLGPSCYFLPGWRRISRSVRRPRPPMRSGRPMGRKAPEPS